MSCSLVEHHGGAWVDGELDPSASLSIEQHVVDCERCRESIAFERSTRAMLREAYPVPRAPDGFRARALSALAEAPASETGSVAHGWGAIGRRPVWAAAAGVALALAVGSAVVRPEGGGVSQAGIAPIFEDVVRLHSDPGQARVDPSQGVVPQRVPRYFRGRVGFPVAAAEFDDPGLRLVAARVSSVGHRRAATLYYGAPNRRLTVVVFDAYDVAPWALRFRTRGREIYYRQVGGYTVPVFRERGVSYALTGDFDAPSLLRLAAEAHVDGAAFASR